MLNNEKTKPDDCKWCRGLCCPDEAEHECDHFCTCGDMHEMYPDLGDYDRDTDYARDDFEIDVEP